MWTLTRVAAYHQWWRILLRGRCHCRWCGCWRRWTRLEGSCRSIGFWFIGGLSNRGHEGRVGISFSRAVPSNGTARTRAVFWTEEDINRSLRALQGHLKTLNGCGKTGEKAIKWRLMRQTTEALSHPHLAWFWHLHLCLRWGSDHHEQLIWGIEWFLQVLAADISPRDRHNS